MTAQCSFPQLTPLHLSTVSIFAQICISITPTSVTPMSSAISAISILLGAPPLSQYQTPLSEYADRNTRVCHR